jgi:hypothetical protein
MVPEVRLEAVLKSCVGGRFSTYWPHPIEGYTTEDRDVRSNNLIYILVVIILVLVALLLLSRLI